MMIVDNNKKTATTFQMIITILGLSLVVSVTTMVLTSQNTMAKEKEKKENDNEYC
jgi:ABC-type phosphate/phosphonate transport system permease subunit